jgi:hypothetical protein
MAAEGDRRTCCEATSTLVHQGVEQVFEAASPQVGLGKTLFASLRVFGQ